MGNLLASSLKTAKLDENGWSDIGSGSGSNEGKFIHWLTIDDLAKSVYADVQRIRLHPLVPLEIPIYGYIYDVKTGQLIEVPEATKVGQGQ